MKWSIGQRMVVGFAVLIILYMVVAAIGGLTRARTNEVYEDTFRQQQTLVNAQEAEAAVHLALTELLRYLSTSDEKVIAGWERGISGARQALTALRDSAPASETRSGWGEVLNLLNGYEEVTRATIAAKKARQDAQAFRLRDERVQPLRDQLVAQISRLIDAERLRTKELRQLAVAEGNVASWIMTVLGAFSAIFGGAVAWVVTRSITKPLRGTIGTLASASSEILAATSQQASRTAEEAAGVQQASTTVDEVKQTAQVSAQKARAVAEGAQQTAQISQEGRREVEESMKAMQEARARMEALAERILALSEQAMAISEVMTTVNDLAEQSNLLAVNAAIEAAKAGEAGRGFAVVANEVKALAEQSKQATAQVRGILNEIQRVTQAAVMAAEQGVKAFEAGEGVARRAGEAIRLLSESLIESAQAAQQILVSTQQQVVGMDQIVLAMQNIQQASTQNMVSTRQVERAAEDLNALARQLKMLVAVSADGSGRNGYA